MWGGGKGRGELKRISLQDNYVYRNERSIIQRVE